MRGFGSRADSSPYEVAKVAAAERAHDHSEGVLVVGLPCQISGPDVSGALAVPNGNSLPPTPFITGTRPSSERPSRQRHP